jgi:ubiquinone biosynthesis protein
MLVSLLLVDDLDAAGQALFELGAVRKPKIALGSDVSSALSPLRDHELGDASYLDFGRRLAELARVHDARLPRELMLVLKQLLYVERYVKLLAPQWKPTEDHEVVAYLMSLLTDSDRLVG